MQPRFFDAHTHVQFAAFQNDYKEVIERALHEGIFLNSVGTQKDTSQRAVEIANEYNEGVFATIGLHPIHTEKSFHDMKELGDTEKAKGFTSRGEEFDYNFYKELASDKKVVAIGECGLDYYRLEENTKKQQINIFVEHIKLAQDVKKPLMIHCRDAFTDLIDTLTTNSKLLNTTPGIIHFFTGTVEDAKKLLKLGFYFTFGGVITFVRDYDEAIKLIPLERILSETDAPYITPAPHRGKRNEPVYVIEVVKKLAEIKGIPLEDMRRRILENVTVALNIKIL